MKNILLLCNLFIVFFLSWVILPSEAQYMYAASDSRRLLVKCDFETPCRSMRVIPISGYDWTVQRGRTKTPETGPVGDHTLGTEKGHFMYTEASKAGNGAVARVQTDPALTPDTDKVCVSFWYHMYGNDIGTLSLHYIQGASDETLWSKNGDQRDSWQFADLAVPSPANRPIRIEFRAERGPGYLSDISVDDITISSCGGSGSNEACAETAANLARLYDQHRQLQMNYNELQAKLNLVDVNAECRTVPNLSIDLPRWMKWEGFRSFADSVVKKRVLSSRPSNLAEVQATIQYARAANLSVRAVGRLHTISPIFADEGQVVMYMEEVSYGDKCRTRLRINADRTEVTMVSGVTARELKEFFYKNNVSISNNVLIQDITMGGVVATLSHGVGLGEGMVADFVVRMRIVNSDGKLVTYDLSDENSRITKAVRGNLGLFGVIYDMTFKVKNPMEVAAVTNRWMTVKQLFYDRELRDILDSYWQVTCIWLPFSGLPMAARAAGFSSGMLLPGMWDPTKDIVMVKLANKVSSSTPCKRAPSTGDVPPAPNLDMKQAAFLGPFFMSESLKPVKLDKVTTFQCMPDVAHTPVMSEIIVEVYDMTATIDINPRDGYRRAFDAAYQLIELMVAYSKKAEFTVNSGISFRFAGYSDTYLAPGQAGNPKNGGHGITLYLGTLILPLTEKRDEFYNELASKFRRIPGTRFHWAKVWSVLDGSDDYMRTSYGQDLYKFLDVLEQSRADPTGMFFTERLEKIFYPGGHPGRRSRSRQ